MKHGAIEWADDAASLHYPEAGGFPDNSGVLTCDLTGVEAQKVPGALIQPMHDR